MNWNLFYLSTFFKTDTLILFSLVTKVHVASMCHQLMGLWHHFFTDFITLAVFFKKKKNNW